MAILAVRLLTTYIMKHLRNTNVEPIEALSMIKYVFKALIYDLTPIS